MFLLGLRRRGCKGKKQSTRAALIGSLGAAIGGVVTAFMHREVRDGDPPKEFPWLAVGIAAGAVMLVSVVAFVQWRRKSEERSDSEEGGPCSR